jgi:chemotaxis protein CheC
MDYLREMMNIGAGNAATALGRLLKCGISSKMPVVRFSLPAELSSIFGDPADPTSGAKFELAGDMSGFVFFLVKGRDRHCFTALARSGGAATVQDDLHVILTTAEAVVAADFDAIKRFCDLDVRHTAAAVTTDMLLALLDEAVSHTVGSGPALVIKHDFGIANIDLSIYFVLLPLPKSLAMLVGSLETARRKIIGVAH